jgi:hypothetical protein
VLQVVTEEHDRHLAEEKLLEVLQCAAPSITILSVFNGGQVFDFKVQTPLEIHGYHW